MNQNSKLIVKWLVRMWFAFQDTNSVLADIEQFWTFLKKLESKNGILYTIKTIKIMRLIITRYISGSPLLVVKERIGIDKTGWPKQLQYLKKYKDSYHNIQFLLTLLNLSRSFTAKSKPDYSSITKPFSGTDGVLIPNDQLERIIKDFNLSLDFTDWSKENMYYTSKAGPRSPNALTSALANIVPSPMTEALTMLVPGRESSKLYKYMTNIFPITTNNKDLLTHGKIVFRRLSIVNDPEGKSRIIAIFDYLTQTVLELYSKQMFDILKTRFPQDRTFTQNPFIKKVDGHKFHSIDLTAATDRFPIQFQRNVLAKLISPSFAHYWSKIMVGESFITPEGDWIKYEVGQPMGARTSWTMFTISHHIVVQFSALQVNCYPFKDYILLGDDIVIANDDVAKQYKINLTILGVETSEAKTHVSENTYEFAKRWFINGVEVSPVPITGLLSSIGKPMELCGYFINIYNRRLTPWKMNSSLNLGVNFIASFSSNSKDRKRGINLYRIVYSLYRYTQGDFSHLRRFLLSALETTDYNLQMSEESLEREFKRFADMIVNGIFWEYAGKAQNLLNKLTDNYELLTGISKETMGKHAGQLPLIVAVFNTVNKLTVRPTPPIDKVNLIDVMSQFDQIDIDPLISRERKHIRVAVHLTNFGKKMFNEIRFDPYQIVNNTRLIKTQRAKYDLQMKLKSYTQ